MAMINELPADESLASNQLRVENPQRDIRLAAMNLLARREHGFQELANKLANKFLHSQFHSPQLIEAQLMRLREEGLQSDERFIEAFINSKKHSGKGPLYIRQQLKQKGLNSESIALALEAISEQWVDLAQQLYQRKYQNKPVADQKEKAKRIRFMLSRGFNSHHFMYLLANH